MFSTNDPRRAVLSGYDKPIISYQYFAILVNYKTLVNAL